MPPEEVEALVARFDNTLHAIVAEGLQSRRLRFVVGAANAAAGADCIFICVATPQGDDGAADIE